MLILSTAASPEQGLYTLFCKLRDTVRVATVGEHQYLHHMHTHRSRSIFLFRGVLATAMLSLLPAAPAVAQSRAESPPAETLEAADGLRSGLGAREFTVSLDWAQVRFVEAEETGEDTWRFTVTVEHRDEGWDHYADVWQVVDPQTLEVYGERVLLHPHDNEQPFTRSQSGIRIPAGVDTILVRARCTVHDWSGQAVLVPLVRGESEQYTVNRR